MSDSTRTTAHPPAPKGRVTLVFTDVQGSTTLWERHTEAMRSALLLHNARLRELLVETGGYEVKTEGDAFMVAFASSVQAVAWCLAAQEALLALDWPEAIAQHEDAAEVLGESGEPLIRGLRVRMGVHAGDPEGREDPVTGRMDYFGPMVNRAARVGGSGHGGQIVVSGAVWRDISAQLAGLGDPAFRELGEHHLKGLASPETLVEVLPASLAARQFPKLKTLEVRRTNLNESSTRFVGRERDLAELKAAFDAEERLLTLLGPGGTGKTRLTQEYGLKNLETYPGGIWFCDLSVATSLDCITEVVGAALEVPLTLGKTCSDTVQQLGCVLAGRGRTLLIMDNFEQVVDFAAASIGEWLNAAPECRFLVSSRELLRLPGETVHELLPLGLPEAGGDIQASEAVQLFIERIRAVRRDFVLSDADAPVVAEIVAMLDGIPLAIELAAARMGVLSPAKLLERLPRRFDLLTTGRRDASARQATLRGLIDWSWDLLHPWEKTALAQCSVFHGGFSLEAAEAIIDLSEIPDAPWALDAVQGLRDKSLIYAYEPAEFPGEQRFGMYLSIRDYAREKLEHSGQALQAIERHAAHYLAYGAQWVQKPLHPLRLESLRHLALERGNLLEVHHRAIAVVPPTPASAMAAIQAVLTLDPLHAIRGPFALQCELLESVLRVSETPGIPRGLRGWAIHARGLTRRFKGLMEGCLVDFERALAIALETGDRELESVSQQMLGLAMQMQGRVEEAASKYYCALETARACPGQPIGRALMALGYLQLELGNLESAKALLSDAIDDLRARGDLRFEGISESHLGYVLLALELPDEAHPRFERALEIAKRLGDRRAEGLILATYGDQAFIEGRLDEALLHYERCIAMLREVGDRRFEALYLSRKGGLMATLDRLEAASLALASAETILAGMTDRVFQVVHGLHAAQLELARGREARASSREQEALGARIQALVRETEAPGPTSVDDPEGTPSLAVLSDEIRLALRVLKRDLAGLAARR